MMPFAAIDLVPDKQVRTKLRAKLSLTKLTASAANPAEFLDLGGM